MRPVELGGTIDMSDIGADLFHSLNNGRGRRGSRRHDLQRPAKLDISCPRVTDHHEQHIRRGTHMGNIFTLNQLENFFGTTVAHTDMGRPDGGDRPGKTPAVAMKHRQGPQINGVRLKRRFDDLSHGMQIDGAVAVHRSLRSACGTGSIVDRDHGIFIVNP